jgi:serine/threonine protein kinase
MRYEGRRRKIRRKCVPGAERALSGDSRFRLVRKLRSTPSFVIYEAVHAHLKQYLVVKLPASDKPESADALQREIAALAQLRHPNNIQIIDAGTLEYDGRRVPYLAVEHLGGDPLSQLIRLYRRLPPRRAVRIVLQVLMALEEAHSHGIVHGDIKPEHVLVWCPAGMFDHVKVIEYGVPLLSPGSGTALTPATGLRIFGTPHYMAPEIAVGGHPTPLADLYAVGVMLYECISGVKPFGGDDALSVLYQRLHHDHLPLHQVVPVSTKLAEAVETAMAKDASKRFSSTREFMQALVALDPEDLAAFQGAEIDLSQPQAPLDTLERGPEGEKPPSRISLSELPPVVLKSTEKPVIWFFRDVLTTAQPAVRSAVDILSARYDVTLLDKGDRSAARDDIAAGRAVTPWVVVFGDMHVLLEDDLLMELANSAETLTVLISAHLNVEMLQTAVNATGLRRHICLPQEPAAIVEAVDEVVQRARVIRQHFDWLRLGLRDARESVEVLSKWLGRD